MFKRPTRFSCPQIIWLVVSTHMKKIKSNWISSPNRGENKTYLKPPANVMCWKSQLGVVFGRHKKIDPFGWVGWLFRGNRGVEKGSFEEIMKPIWGDISHINNDLGLMNPCIIDIMKIYIYTSCFNNTRIQHMRWFSQTKRDPCESDF